MTEATKEEEGEEDDRRGRGWDCWCELGAMQLVR